MNGRKIPKLKGKHVRLRPFPKRFDRASGQWVIFDNEWFVHDAGRYGVTLENSGYGDTLRLSADQVHEFRTDPSQECFGFLNLHGQAWVSGTASGVEPLIRNQEELSPLPEQMTYSVRRHTSPAVPYLIVCAVLAFALSQPS
jgi:hypothetical protein